MTVSRDDTCQAACEEACRRAERGDLAGAAALFRQVIERDPALRGRAALGLAVVCDELGDLAEARRADQMAIDTGDVHYGPRAAWHLALSLERDGEIEQARRAWRQVVDFGDTDCLAVACLALGDLAERAGEQQEACAWWSRAVRSGDGEVAATAAFHMAVHLTERGEPSSARELLTDALAGCDHAAAPRLHLALALTHLDEAAAALAATLDGDDQEITGLAVELLARLLPLRGHDEQAAKVWQAGLAHPDPAVADEVAARLRRGLAGVGQGEAEPWWQRLIASAVGHGSLVPLTAEVFTVVEQMATRIAAALVTVGDHDARRELTAALEVSDAYAWGAALRASLQRAGQAAPGPS